MHAASIELERRRPVWAALSELFLDAELQPDDHQRIADVLRASGYAEAELDWILRREVGPVLLPNLLSVAGEWVGFDLARLESEILRAEPRRRFRWLPELAAMSMVRHDWGRIRSLLNPARTT